MNGLEPVLPLALAILFGCAIGVERQWHHKTAGIKTNALVALGAAGFAMLSAHGFGPSNNPAQLASSVVTGIGFIGAGVIIHRGASIQGVNTAATLWANASMGVATGAGHYAVGIAIVVAILFTQILTTYLSRAINRIKSPEGVVERFEIRVSADRASHRLLESAWSALASNAAAMLERRTVAQDSWGVVFTCPAGSLDLPSFEERVLSIEGVQAIETRKAAQERSEDYSVW